MKSNKALSEVTSHISRGISPKYCDQGFAVLNQRCVRDNRIDFGVARKTDERKTRIPLAKFIRRWDVLVNSTGVGTLGRVAQILTQVEGVTVDSHVSIVRPDLDRLCGRYFGYAMVDRESYIASLGAGATGQTELARDRIAGVEISYHDLATQRKIATFLSAYDDLIENNLRRIKILEEIARLLYREWFVKFRFPGHEKVRMVDSPLGKIPEGWKVKKVEDAFRILGGGTPSKKILEYWENGSINWYTPSDLTSNGTMFIDKSGSRITELGLRKSSAQLFPPFSVMMTSRATLGVISINTSEACTNQGFITCLPNERFPLYTLYHWLKENVEFFISQGTGSTFKEITKGVFKTLDFVLPPLGLVTKYENVVGPLGSQVLNSQRKNHNLRQTRDILLPKLISGELDVSDLDIKVMEDI